MTRMLTRSASAAVVKCLMENDPAIVKAGFRKAIQAIIPEASADFIPDAYAIRHDLRTIDIIEVVDTNPIMRPKAAKIGDLALAAGDAGWDVSVIGYDSCGGVMCELPGTIFLDMHLAPLMRESQGNAIPAAMSANRQTSTMPMDDLTRLWCSIP